MARKHASRAAAVGLARGGERLVQHLGHGDKVRHIRRALHRAQQLLLQEQFEHAVLAGADAKRRPRKTGSRQWLLSVQEQLHKTYPIKHLCIYYESNAKTTRL